ncbi:glycosyltransferase family 2 protein [Halobacterium litoreum]|uniref:Glycosyltransferase family 2 protein n=1 Tax=Halobacterium litoreum TaxID=2039234 RepID=A0ABD5NBQ2_9EURY|nr:glycosyltransferase family 2 protein [Halobacterium litoreum]UHH14412.1 glycosyltransferase family 2 protein [Halobacterium litoreum]
MYHGKTIGAVVPAYNEADHIGGVIDTLPEFVDRAYVVDDGSTDDTLRVIRDHAAAANEHLTDAPETATGVTLDPRVVPVAHEENRGVGGAIKTGYQRALADGVDVTLVIAGDGQTEPDIVERIVAPVAAGDADYAKGNRLGDRDRDAMPRHRQFGNFVLSFLTKVASGYWDVMDPQNGSTAISRDALNAVDIEEMYEDYGYCNDLLVRLNAVDATIADVPRRAVYEDETSHISLRSYVPKVSSLLARDFAWRLKAKYFDHGSYPVPLLYVLGILGTGVGVAAATGTLLFAVQGAVDAFAVLAASALFVVLAMILDRTANRDLAVTADEAR